MNKVSRVAFALLLLALSLLMLSGCEVPKEVAVEDRFYEVVDINPPKRFYVTLRDLKTAEVFEVYVSKRCWTWRELKIGSTVTLERVTYEKPNGEQFYRYTDVRKLCP